MTASLTLGPVGDVRLSRINPVAQLTAIAVVTLVLLTSLDVVTPAVVVAAELCLLPAAGLTRPGDLLRRTWPVLLGATSVGAVNVLLSDEAGVVTGLGLALRVIGLALPGVLLVASTDPVRLADALTIHWRVSTRFAYGALAALRLAPLLVAEFEAARLARRTRGPAPACWPGWASPCSSGRCAGARAWRRPWTPEASIPASHARTPAAPRCTAGTAGSWRSPPPSARSPSR